MKSGRGCAASWQFILVFAALLAAYYAVILTPFFDRLLYHYLVANAWAAARLLRAAGQEATAIGVTIRGPGAVVGVRRGCDAIEPAWFYSAAILAFPAHVRRKLPALLAGSAIILLLNPVRIASLVWIERVWPAAFPTLHLEIWPAVFIGLALALWWRWARPA